MEQLNLFDILPRRPYCADAKDGLRLIRSAASAIRRPYIQPNTPALRLNLVFDVDREGAGMVWDDASLPPPTFTVARRDRGDSAHLWYGLRVPVRMADPEDASRAMRYAAAVELGMTRQLGADLAYTAAMAKTPTHSEWRTFRGPTLYDLDELADYVRELPKLPSRREAIRTGIGRNVELFDCTRFWAYRHARDHKSGSFEQWHATVRERAMLLNSDLFSDPLSAAEVFHTAKSIARWVWSKERAMTAAFHNRQAARSRSAAKVRSATSAALTTAIIEENT
jgi:hypothetical protein